MSSVSKTTVGGAEFELLCRGAVRNYSANPANLTGQTEVKAIKKKLITQLKDTVKALEIGSERTIAKIYIGKTYIKRRRAKGRRYQKFNPLKHHTWKKNGISSRWGEHRHKDYGRDGLVVLGAITRETMPERCRDRVHQEDFALAMEQKLLHHYLLSHPDPKVPVVNETFTTGQATREKCHAYAIYMAFRYEGEASSSAMCQFTEPDPSRISPSPSPTPSPPPSEQHSSSVQQKQQTPDMSVQRVIPSTTGHSNRQKASRKRAGDKQASSMNQSTAPGTPTRGRAATSPATRLYNDPPGPSNLEPRSTNESQQSTRSSNRHSVSVRFDETRMPKRLRKATKQRSITIDLTEE